LLLYKKLFLPYENFKLVKLKINNPLDFLKSTPLTFEGRGMEIIGESQSKGVTTVLLFPNTLLNKYHIIA
jgi:hypothetical protein